MNLLTILDAKGKTLFDMDFQLVGKNALVCGGSKGIGRASAIALAELGCNVTIVSRSPGVMSQLLAEMRRDHPQDHDFLSADFRDPEDLRKKVRRLITEKPIHILVNNTGGPPAQPLLDASESDLEAAFRQHIVSFQLLVQLIVPSMMREGFGRIINIVSTSVKEPIPGLGVSNTIRGAVGNWAKTLANEVGPYSITVNNVLPGSTNTDRLREIFEHKARDRNVSIEQVIDEAKASIPLGRIAEPSEIAAGVAFLASPAASYITGTNLTIDGGRTKSL